MEQQNNETTTDLAYFDTTTLLAEHGADHFRIAPLLVVANLFIILLGVAGNGLVLVAMVNAKRLHTIPNVFIANLAVTDFLFCLALPATIVAIVGKYHPSFHKMCFAVLFIAHSTIGCSTLTLASIALNRLILILSPRKYYQIIFKKKVIIVWIALLWIYSMMIAGLPPVALGVGKLEFDPAVHFCRSPPTYDKSKVYDNILTYGFFPVPLTIMVISYGGIFVRIYQHNRKMTKHSRESRASVSADSFDTQDHSSQNRGSDNYRRQIHITVNMFITFCAFVVCGAPIAICNGIYEQECPIDVYVRLLASFNSAVNPVIYGVFHPQFRRVYLKIFKCDTINTIT